MTEVASGSGTSQPTLVDLVSLRALLTPDRTLLVDEHGRSCTSLEFETRTAKVAERLAVAGIGPGSVVSWILPTDLDALVIMVALAKVQATQNPIIPMYREREIGHILDELAVDAVIVRSEWRGFDYLKLCHELSDARGGAFAVVPVDEVVRDDGKLHSVPQLDSRRDLGAARWVFYTSGSTARPKGVLHTDEGLAAAATGMARHLDMSESDRSGIAFPIAHVGGVINLMAALLTGAGLILIEKFESAQSVAVLAREGVTMAGSGTAFHLAYLDIQGSTPDEPIFPQLRCCPGGGAAKPPGLHLRVKKELGGVGILSGWGLTEAPILTMSRPADPDAKLSETEGVPLPGVVVRAVGTDGCLCTGGIPGELRVHAPQLMLGYVDSSLDAEAFDEHGYFRTGDIGIVDGDGYVRITGRLKDVVIRNGENIAIAEVEELLRAHPVIADVAVIGLPDARSGERVCAVVEVLPGSPILSVSVAGEYLGVQGLRKVAWPEQVETVASLPRTVAGKIDRQQLRELFGTNGPADPSVDAPEADAM